MKGRLFRSERNVAFIIVVILYLGCSSFGSFGIDLLLTDFGGLEAVDVSSELDDFAEEVRGFLFPVGHGFLGVRMTWRELFYVS